MFASFLAYHIRERTKHSSEFSDFWFIQISGGVMVYSIIVFPLICFFASDLMRLRSIGFPLFFYLRGRNVALTLLATLKVSIVFQLFFCVFCVFCFLSKQGTGYL